MATMALFILTETIRHSSDNNAFNDMNHDYQSNRWQKTSDLDLYQKIRLDSLVKNDFSLNYLDLSVKNNFS